MSLINTNVRCNICHVTAYDSPTGRLVRDHNHRTGFIRGRLCDLCNAYVSLIERNKSGSKRFKKWRKQFRVRIEKHLSNKTDVMYFSGKKERADKVHFYISSNASLLCRKCGVVSKVSDVQPTGYLLSCGHFRGY